MKKFYAIAMVFTLLCAVAHAQKAMFIRIYSLTGHKFKKGYFAGTTDSSLLIRKDKSIVEIPAVIIGFIRTKRSAGHELAMSELTFALPLTALGAVVGMANEGDNDGIPATAIGAGIGFSLGSIIGIPIGAAGTIFTKHTVIKINGDIDTWHLQRQRMDMLPALQ